MSAQPLADLVLRLRLDGSTLGADAQRLGGEIGAVSQPAEAAAASIAVVDRAAQKFMQSLQGEAQALKDEAATIGMTRTELLAYQAAKLGITDAAAPLIAQIGGEASALKALRDSVASASTSVNAFGETEAEAAARISDMVARSREAQAALGATTSAASSGAAGLSAFATSSEQVRSTVAAQNAALAATAAGMASMNGELQTLRTVAAQSGSTFQALGEQYSRLDLLMASGKLSMEDYDVTLASLAKDEDRRLAQLAALTARYDPLDATTRKLASDQALLDDAYKSGQVSADQYAKALNGIEADRASVQLHELEQQEVQLEASLRSGSIAATAYKKAMADIAASKAALNGVAGGANSAGNAVEGFGLKTAGARKEVVVLAHEMLTGNWSNFGGSVMVLAERMDLMEVATSEAALGLVAMAAPAIALGAAMYKVSEQNAAMNDAILLTGNYAGVTDGQLRDMATAATAGGATFDTAAEAVTALAATGRLTGQEIADLGRTTADAATYTSVSVKQMVDDFTRLAEDPVKASVSLNDQYHYLTASTYDQIVALQQQGDATGAAQVAVDAFSKAMDDRTGDIAKNEGIILAGWRDIKSAINLAVEAVGSFGSASNPARDVAYWTNLKKEALAGAATWDSDDEAALQDAIRRRDDALKAAQIKQSQAMQAQQLIDAKQYYATWNAQFATPAEKRVKEVNEYLDKTAALNLSPEQQLADEQKINERDKDKTGRKSGTGLVDRTELTGEVQTVKDALASEVAAVAGARKVLDAQYKSGSLAVADYYQQDRDLLAQAATDHIDAANREASLITQGMHNRKLSAAQRAQLANQQQKALSDGSKAVEDFFAKVSESAAQEDEVWDKYGQSQLAATQRQIDSANQQGQSLRDQIDTFGMTKSAIDDLKASRADDTVAALEQGRAIALLRGDLANTQPWDDAIAKAKSLSTALHGVADDQSMLDDLARSKKQQDDLVRGWQSTIDGIGSDFHNGFLQMLTDGKNGWSSFTQSLKNTFETTVVDEIYKSFAKPFVVSIVAQLAGITNGGGVQNSIFQNNGQGGSSTLTNLFSNPTGTYNNLSNGYDTVIQWLQGYGGASTALGSSAIAGAGAGALSSGGAVLGGLSGGIGGDVAASAGSYASALGSNAYGFTVGQAGGGLGSTLGSSAGLMYGGAGLLGGLAGGALFGNRGYSSLGGSVGAMGGLALGASSAVGGTALGASLGSMAGPIGAVIGMALGALVGSLIGGGETRYGATYDSTPGGAISNLGGPSGGDPASTQVQQQIASTYTQMQQLATQLGGSVTGLGDYRAGYEISPSKGNSWVQTGFGSDMTRTDLSGVKDSTTVLNDLTLAMQQSVIKGLQEANLDSPYAAVLQGIDPSKLSASDITALLNELGSLKSLFDSFNSLGDEFTNLKDASTDAKMNVINLAGGMDNLNTEMSYFAQNFTSTAEQTAAQAKSVTDQLAALGESGVTTNDQFRQAVEGIDLSTEAGQQLYQQMLALAPAFNAMTQAELQAQQAAQQAADAQQSLWDQYFSSVYTSSQQAAMGAKQLQDQFDALGVAMPKSNADFEALVESMDTSTQPMKDLQNALLALAPTFAQVTQAVQAALGANEKAAISTLSSSAQGLLTDRNNASSLLDSINTSITGNDPDTSGQISDLWSEMTSGVSLTQQIDLATQLNDLITKRYQTEQQAVSTLTDESKQLLDYVQSLKAGDLSTETPSEKLADAAQQYADTLAKAQGGDQTAIGDLSGAADNYLKLAQTYYASSDTYTQIFDSVTSQISSFGDALQSQGASSDALAQQSLDQLQQLQQAVQSQYSQANSQYQGVVSQLAQQLSALDAIEQAAGVQSEVPSILKGLPTDLAAALAGILGTGVATGSGQISNLYQQELGRDGDDSGMAYWTGALSNGSKTLADFEYSADQEKIGDLYQQVLGRAADASGLQYYTNQLFQGKETLDQIKADLQYAAVNGSHAGGADYIPFDGYRAELHKGEAVVTSANNVKLAKMLNIDWSQYGAQNTVALASGIRALIDRVGQLENALVQASAQSTSTLVAATDRSAQTISAGTQKAADINQRTAMAKPPLR
jgi:phage-related minor tail protein